MRASLRRLPAAHFCPRLAPQTQPEDLPNKYLKAHSFASGTTSSTAIHSLILSRADQIWQCRRVSVSRNNMRSYNFLLFALCSVFSLSAAQTASATPESSAETSTVEATTGVTTSPAATATSGGGTASNATTSAGGGTGTTTSAGSTSTKGPPDVLLKVPNLSVKRIEYAILTELYISCILLLIKP